MATALGSTTTSVGNQQYRILFKPQLDDVLYVLSPLRLDAGLSFRLFSFLDYGSWGHYNPYPSIFLFFIFMPLHEF